MAPMMILGTDVACIPYLMYIYLLRIYDLIFLKIYKSKNYDCVNIDD